MPENKHPWYKHYPADWLLGTTGLTLEQQGLYQRLLDVEWREGSIPDEVELISNLTSTHLRVIRRLTPTLLQLKFELTSTGWINKRLERERQVQVEHIDKMSEAGKRGGAKRWQGHSKKIQRHIKRIDTDKESREIQKKKPDLSDVETIPEPKQTPYLICEQIKAEINKLHGKPTVLTFTASLRPMKELLAQGVTFHDITEVYRAVFDSSLNGDTNANWHRGKLSNATFGNHLLKNWGDLQIFLKPASGGMAAKIAAINEEMGQKYGG